MLRIGITGPIGCGKSTVAGWLEDLGAVAIDADDVARDVTAPGEPTLGSVFERFGDSVRASDGSLDRAALGRIVFADASALADLERIVHPAVRSRIYEALAANVDEGVDVTVIEAIKLVEGGLADIGDEVWLVTCDRDDQRRRLLSRGTSIADADQRIAAQGDIADRLAPRATRVIDTSTDLETAREAVVAAWRELGLA